MSGAAFIALQCCQCSTMQVKQRKKSSSKWTCVVCNEKQSMRHVFAQGPMAPDVRKFVQTFNMSRQFTDQNRRNCEETLAPSLAEEDKPIKKRTDWSEYIEQESEIKDEIEDPNEPNIVTEMPKALFRKPKLNTYAGRLGTNNEGNGFKPNFAKRKSLDISAARDREPNKYLHTPISKAPKWSNRTEEQEPTCNRASKLRTYPTQKSENDWALKTVPGQLHSTSAKILSKWNNYTVQDKNENEVPVPCHQIGKAKQVSKWDEYVTTEEDDDARKLKGLRDISNRAVQRSDDEGEFDVSLCGERVEEDIHPDFL